ncbi:MAG: hypothetical protein AAB788_01865 [Patescibacteria group bacterium]
MKKNKDIAKYLDRIFNKNTLKIIKFLAAKFNSVDEKFEKIDKKLIALDDIFKILNGLVEYKPNFLKKRFFAS